MDAESATLPVPGLPEMPDRSDRRRILREAKWAVNENPCGATAGYRPWPMAQAPMIRVRLARAGRVRDLTAVSAPCFKGTAERPCAPRDQPERAPAASRPHSGQRSGVARRS